jgi:hypothetical protein
MSVITGTASDVPDLLVKLDAFLTKGHSLELAYAGAGDGRITGLIGTPASVLEEIEVTFSDATNFAVTGTVSGALGAGTVGTIFTSTVASFTITAGSTPWGAGDTITFMMTPPWEQLRAANLGTGIDEYIWKAPGNDGASSIYVGLNRFTNATGDYDNLRLLGATGYDAGQTFANQPNSCSRPILPLLRSGSMPFWFIASGRRVIIAAKVSTVYECAYLGLLLQYQNPNQYQYPLVVGGSMSWDTEPAATSVNWRWSYQSEVHRAFPLSGYDSSNTHNRHQLRYRNPAGVWIGATMKSYSASYSPIGYIWPYWGMNDMRPNLDGSYPLFPVVLHEDFQHTFVSGQVDGELEGVFATTGYGAAAEDLITVGRKHFLIMQNIYRTSKENYFALELM